jgi:hypothetical protein
MSNLDHSLIYQARQLITGANVHHVKTWIFCYETSQPNSAHRQRYERLLREFVAAKNLTLGVRLQAQLARDRGIALQSMNPAIEEVIRRLGRKSL